MNIYRGRNRTEVYLASILYDSIEDQDINSIIKLLTEKHADPNLILPEKGISSFHLTIGNESESFALQVTALIIQHGGDPNVKSDEGLTPVHIAAAWGRLNILDLLLKCGGDPQVTDNCYKSPIDYAKSEKHLEAVRIMQELIDYQRTFLFNETKKPTFIMKLDKVLLNSGQLIGEYKPEIVSNNAKKVDMKKLKEIPLRNNSHYVQTWCNSQDPTNSYQDSNSQDLDPLDFGSSSSQNSQKSTGSFKFNKRKPPIDSTCSSIDCDYKESSRESGILTFPESEEENTRGLYDDDFNRKLDRKLINSNANKDSSSDYCTCTDGSMDLNINQFERNIFDIGSICTEKSSIDATFVSISEIYKYTDDEEGVVLYEKRVLTPTISANGNESVITTLSQISLPKTFDYDTDVLRKELKAQGFDPGPITKTTKRVYLKKLYHIKQHPEQVVANIDDNKKVYSRELQKTLTDPLTSINITRYSQLEDEMRHQFISPDPSRRWREGTTKSSFTYLLLDPRITQNLPNRYEKLDKSEIWRTFLDSIFYVGKGKRSRPYSHLYSAVRTYNKDVETDCEKLKRIRNIWSDKYGVICLHLFQNTIPVEAYTREAAMIHALKLENVTNKKYGDYYGVAATWNQQQKCVFGVFLLYKALQIFLHEGERQLYPNDID
nr:ankyrin repeat and LEM domain-containing protein 1 [Onthophagus taurus]